MYAVLPIGEVRPNPDQPRKHFDAEALEELAASIRSSGLLQPITVRRVEADLVIVAGERRWRACHLAGLAEVEVRILDDLDEVDAYVLSVAENISRADMTVMEEVKAFDHLVRAGKTTEEVAALFGKSGNHVRWRLDLLRLRPDAQDLLDRGVLRASLAWYLSELEPASQQTALRRYVQGEFASEAEAVAYAQAVKQREGTELLFGEEETVEQQQERVARRKAARARLDAVAKAVGALEVIAAADPARLAEDLMGEVASQAARMDDVLRVARRAAETMRQAKVIALAASDA